MQMKTKNRKDPLLFLEILARRKTLSENPEQSDGISNMQSITQEDAADEADDNGEIKKDHYEASGRLIHKKENAVEEQQLCGLKMEKPKMPSFSGDVRKYAIFRSDFKHAVEARSFHLIFFI